jgi:hypothetical protein
MPTNYFAFTPRLGLSGLGALTNDATTPYPHGFTNEFTITGGTNFPSSRTNWYDTDYGLAGFSNIIAETVWTITNATLNGTTLQGSWVFNKRDGHTPAFWTQACVTAESNFPSNTVPAQPYAGYVTWSYDNTCAGGEVAGGAKWAAFVAGTEYYLTTPLNANATNTHDVEFYMFSTNWLVCVNSHSVEVYDSLGETLQNGIFSYMDYVSASSITNTMSAVFGSTNMPTRPTYTGNDVAIGWSGGKGSCLIRWDVTNGFKFK